MKIAISGFGKDKQMCTFLKKHGYTISEIVTKDTNCIIINEDIDYIQYKSSKIKHALQNNVPILSLEDSTKENVIKQLKNLKDKVNIMK
tara:strand:+ start:322 stop:588 length:267 start_codon:yes stop_codon:yes gene_type:complete